MAVQHYGVLKGTVSDMKGKRSDDSPHFQVEVLGEPDTLIAVRSMSCQVQKNQRFCMRHAIILTQARSPCCPTFRYGYPIDETSRELALDYVRGGLFDPGTWCPSRMKSLVG